MATAVEPLPAAIRVAALMRAQSFRSPPRRRCSRARRSGRALRPQAVLLRGAGGAAMAACIQPPPSRGRACRVFHARPGEAESASPERLLLPVLRAFATGPAGGPGAAPPRLGGTLPRAAAVAQGYRLRGGGATAMAKKTTATATMAKTRQRAEQVAKLGVTVGQSHYAERLDSLRRSVCRRRRGQRRGSHAATSLARAPPAGRPRRPRPTRTAPTSRATEPPNAPRCVHGLDPPPRAPPCDGTPRGRPGGPACSTVHHRGLLLVPGREAVGPVGHPECRPSRPACRVRPFVQAADRLGARGVLWVLKNRWYVGRYVGDRGRGCLIFHDSPV